MLHCTWEKNEEGRYFCPVCDSEQELTVKTPAPRNCQTRFWYERRAVCKECPIEMWDDEENHCQKHSNGPCQFNRLLASPFFECEHWPETSREEIAQ